MIELLTIIFGCLLYSVAYLYILGLRIIRQNLDEKTSAVLLASFVGLSVLAATVTFEAVVLIGVARPVSGSLFYVASGLGIFLVGAAAAGVAGIPKPIKVALAHKQAASLGIIFGNIALVTINILSFAGKVPTVL